MNIQGNESDQVTKTTSKEAFKLSLFRRHGRSIRPVSRHHLATLLAIIMIKELWTIKEAFNKSRQVALTLILAFSCQSTTRRDLCNQLRKTARKREASQIQNSICARLN